MRWCASWKVAAAADAGGSVPRSSCVRYMPVRRSRSGRNGFRTARSASVSCAKASRSRTECWFPMVREPVEAAPEPRAGTVQRTSAVQWAAEPERGSAPLITAMAFLALRLGRPLARLILYVIAAYFFLFAPRARRHARAYLQRTLRREPTASDLYRHVFTFAT